MTIEQIARVSHELNRAYCESIGDTSQPLWDDAPEWQKSSAVNGVRFHLDNPDASPSASHESWLKQKTEEGWKYGTVKNAETKEHPCYVPYNELPVEQRAKDYIFRQVIHSLKTYLIGEADLVSFGNYLLSKERRERFESHPEPTGTIEERLSQVHDADIANWLDDRAGLSIGPVSDGLRQE